MTIFDMMNSTQASEKESIPCKIYDWRVNNSLEFKIMIKN